MPWPNLAFSLPGLVQGYLRHSIEVRTGGEGPAFTAQLELRPHRAPFLSAQAAGPQRFHLRVDLPPAAQVPAPGAAAAAAAAAGMPVAPAAEGAAHAPPLGGPPAPVAALAAQQQQAQQAQQTQQTAPEDSSDDEPLSRRLVKSAQRPQQPDQPQLLRHGHGAQAQAQRGRPAAAQQEQRGEQGQQGRRVQQWEPRAARLGPPQGDNWQLQSAPPIAAVPEESQQFLSSIPNSQLVAGVPDDAPLVRFYVQKSVPRKAPAPAAAAPAPAAAVPASALSGSSRQRERIYGYFLPRYCLVLARYVRVGSADRVWRIVGTRKFGDDAGNTCGRWKESFKVETGNKPQQLQQHLAAAYPEAAVYRPYGASQSPNNGAAAAAAAAAAGGSVAAAIGQGAGSALRPAPRIAAAAVAATAAAAGAAGPSLGSRPATQVSLCAQLVAACSELRCCACCGNAVMPSGSVRMPVLLLTIMPALCS